jgi:hypothetical protein
MTPKIIYDQKLAEKQDECANYLYCTMCNELTSRSGHGSQLCGKIKCYKYGQYYAEFDIKNPITANEYYLQNQ